VPQATVHDGSPIEIEVHGDGPWFLLPVNPRPVEGERADELRRWGADPELGPSLIKGLSDLCRVVAFDYEGHVFAKPKPKTLTPDNVAADLLAVADAAGADRFGYYGYSWLAMVGLQLAIRTDRLTALVMGGWPPLDAPYDEMLEVEEASVARSLAKEEGTLDGSDDDPWSSAALPLDQSRQFLTLYQGLRGFDDRAVQRGITCPRLCIVGSEDYIDYPPEWGGVRVSMAGPVLERRAELEKLGWDVRLLDGLDHTKAMLPTNVLPVLRPWLAAVTGTMMER
jgi:pimeloyl-ACP methyl ester carboxylesterase